MTKMALNYWCLKRLINDMHRTQGILGLRPSISTINKTLNTTTAEQFQNDTLRPILKFQHEIITAMFKTCLQRNKVDFSQQTSEEKEATVNTLFQKDIVFKNQVTGAVLGMLTTQEYDTYSCDASGYGRRISTMLKQRILSSY
jgi:hypothetical protein